MRKNSPDSARQAITRALGQRVVEIDEPVSPVRL